MKPYRISRDVKIIIIFCILAVIFIVLFFGIVHIQEKANNKSCQDLGYSSWIYYNSENACMDTNNVIHPVIMGNMHGFSFDPKFKEVKFAK